MSSISLRNQVPFQGQNNNQAQMQATQRQYAQPQNTVSKMWVKTGYIPAAIGGAAKGTFYGAGTYGMIKLASWAATKLNIAKTGVSSKVAVAAGVAVGLGKLGLNILNKKVQIDQTNSILGGNSKSFPM